MIIQSHGNNKVHVPISEPLENIQNFWNNDHFASLCMQDILYVSSLHWQYHFPALYNSMELSGRTKK